ncbi:MAG TPA: IS1595 family transposase [Stellaceae bacterium]|nr:IS1595 family transposase [Stellaceae bacterium]
MSILTRPYFRDEQAAHAFLESILWPHGPVCPHCGGIGKAYRIAANPERRVRHGLWKCGHRECRKQFTVKMASVFEHARIPLHKCLQAAYLLCASKKGMSSNQLSRTLEISLKAAWFLSHRLREAMRQTSFVELMGGDGKTVEIDEHWVGGREKNKHAWKRVGKEHGPFATKEPVFALVERGGAVRSFHVPNVKGSTLREIVNAHLEGKTVVYTDDNRTTKYAARDFESESVNHTAGEYVRGDAHTNTIESYFAIMRRGIVGTYHHVSQQHLKRYLAEFDFRYSNRVALEVDDVERTVRALLGSKGKRLTYKPAANLAT